MGCDFGVVVTLAAPNQQFVTPRASKRAEALEVAQFNSSFGRESSSKKL